MTYKNFRISALCFLVFVACGKKPTVTTTAAASTLTPNSTTTTGTTVAGVAVAIPLPGKIHAAQPIYNFGQVIVGNQSALMSIDLTNTGAVAAAISQIVVDPPFFIKANTCPMSLAPAVICTVRVQFNPTSIVNLVVPLLVSYDAKTEAPASLYAGGAGVPLYVIESLDFGNVLAGNSAANAGIRITNVGTAAGNPIISYNSTTTFPIVSHGACDSSALAPSASCTITVGAAMPLVNIGPVQNTTLVRVLNPNGQYVNSRANATIVVGGQNNIYRNIRLVPGYIQAYLPSYSPNEGAPDYHTEGQLTKVFASPFNSVCNRPVFRGFYVENGRAHHMLSLGGEPALTYDNKPNQPFGYICNQPVSYATRVYNRYFLPTGAGGIWIDSVDPNEQSSLRSQGFSEAPLGYVP